MPKLAYLIAAAALVGAATSAGAADMGGSGPSINSPTVIPPEEIGSGWYLRGDVGYQRNLAPGLSYGNVNFKGESAEKSFDLGFGVGMKFDTWLRFDVTAEKLFKYGVKGNAPCYNGTCAAGQTTKESGNFSAWNFMANGYVDFGNWAGLTPYAGAGLGMARVDLGAHRSQSLDPNATNPTFHGKTDWALSAAAMAGVSYDFGNGAAIDVGYRYLWIDQVETGRQFNGTGIKQLPGVVAYGDNSSHQIRVGVRYSVW